MTISNTFPLEGTAQYFKWVVSVPQTCQESRRYVGFYSPSVPYLCTSSTTAQIFATSVVTEYLVTEMDPFYLTTGLETNLENVTVENAGINFRPGQDPQHSIPLSCFFRYHTSSTIPSARLSWRPKNGTTWHRAITRFVSLLPGGAKDAKRTSI